MRQWVRAALPLMFASSALPAVTSAATLAHFVINGPTPSSYSSFDIPLSPDVSSYSADSFDIDGVPTNFYDSVYGPYTGVLDYTFYSAVPLEYPTGGFAGREVLSGDQLFNGPTSAPTFRTGEFTLYREDSAEYRVGITAVAVSGVPETASWMLFISGFGMIGAMMRRRSVSIRLT